ncbi:MAG: single-stranded DNA-binding protein [Bacteroidetes bacterium]|nr:single-stranded DNA-binding protein [Bacteroidota bacterium]
MELYESVLDAAVKLRKDISKLQFREERKWIYNPLEYAWEPYKQYVKWYGNSRKKVLFLGMNPGPWGMAQTGIPFGEIGAVSDWLRIDAPINKPQKEHPKRPVAGYECNRSEVSGRRLWGLMVNKFTTPKIFFTENFVLNYCPLVFMEESGKNLTPDKLSKEEREPLDALCDAHLKTIIELLKPEFLVGVGKYAEKKFSLVVSRFTEDQKKKLRIVSVLHPSPASPAANRGWEAAAEKQLKEAAVWG